MDRREREKSRYKRGMAADTAKEASRRAGEMFMSNSLSIPKGVKMLSVKSEDKALRLDILPYEVGKGNPFADEGEFHYERTYWVHAGVGPDNRKYPCPNRNSNSKLPCPICEEVKRIQDDEDMSKEDKDKLLNAIRPKRRQLFNVIDVNEPEAGVQLWDISFHLFGKKLLDMLDDEEFAEERRNFCEFEGGKTLRIKFKKEGSGKMTYFEASDIAFIDRKEDYSPDKMLKKVHCLDNCIKTVEYDELQQVFSQSGEKANSNPKFRRSDLKRIDDMTDKDLNKFIAMNDIELDVDNFKTTEELAEAVKDEVRKALEAEGTEESEDEDEPKAKKGKKKDEPKSKKGKKKDEEEEEPEESEDEPEDEDEEETGEDEDTDNEDEDESEESEDEDEEEAPAIEKGSNVTWTDEDDDEHEGEVVKIKKDVATVKEGKKTFEVDLSDLTLA